MNDPIRCLSILTAVVLVSASLHGGTAPPRRIEATYIATVTGVPEDAPALRYWAPLPTARASQRVTIHGIDAPGEWTRVRDTLYGNDYITGVVQSPGPTVEVRVRFSARRDEVRFANIEPEPVSPAELVRNLRADRLVTISPRVQAIADELTEGIDDPLEQARAIYRHVLASMRYDKSIDGWGRGDTERACDVGTGNCTDFHSLFMSLARARGIPARFVIGFSLSDQAGEAAGYHCWAEFHVEGRGWVPVDASDASKSGDPALRDYLFGNLDPARVEFTRGRDLILEPAAAEPINYFIYPIAEVDGRSVGTPSIRLEHRELPEQRSTR